MISRSPKRNTFQLESYLASCEKNDEELDEAHLDWLKNISSQHLEKEQDPKWRENNLEYDLRSTDWILEKVRSNNAYAQNLYAALCNNKFLKMDIIPILKEDYWTCSWRYAGGIIADMRQEGDYIDWYCSGISSGEEPETYEQQMDLKQRAHVSEGHVTDEIYNDLKILGWIISNEDH